MDNENSIVNKPRYITLSLFSQVPLPPSSRHAYAPTIIQDEDELPANDGEIFAPQGSKRLEEQATRVLSPRAPAGISQQALYLSR